MLAQHRGKLVTHRQLLHEVWGPAYETETQYLRVHFAHIRAKIEPDPSTRATWSPSRASATGCDEPLA